MKGLLPLTALLVIGGCSSDGDRGAPAPSSALSPPISKETLESMPPEARQAAQQSMEAGKAMNEQMNARYGKK